MKMYRTRLLLIAVILLCTTVVSYGEDKVGFEVTADYFGKYIWGGQNLSDAPVFHPGISMTMGGLTAGIWGNVETTNINDNSGEFTEYDYSLGWLIGVK